MERKITEALRHRRSYYRLTAESPVPDAEIERIAAFALKHTPSAYNSQSTRLVLLLHEHHAALWKIVLRALRAAAPAESFDKTRSKVEQAFASGYGTVLFYEDTNVVRTLQQRHPLYAGSFPAWSEHTSAMHQLVVWTLLEEAGFGASLQHYNPLIDAAVRREWSLPETWQLIAQMPFGLPAAEPEEKTSEPVEARMRIFR